MSRVRLSCFCQQVKAQHIIKIIVVVVIIIITIIQTSSYGLLYKPPYLSRLKPVKPS